MVTPYEESKPMARASALLPGLHGTDLRREIENLYEFSVSCIKDHGIFDHDSGDISLGKLYEIQHFIAAVEQLADPSSCLGERLAGTGLTVLSELGRLSVDNFVSIRYRSFVPYYVILSHILGLPHYSMKSSGSGRTNASTNGKELLVSTYLFGEDDCKVVDSQGRVLTGSDKEAVIHVSTTGDRKLTIVSGSTIPF